MGTIKRDICSIFVLNDMAEDPTDANGPARRQPGR